MCPVVVLGLLLSMLLFLVEVVAALTVSFVPARVQIKEEMRQTVNVSLYDTYPVKQIQDPEYYEYELRIKNPSIALLDGHHSKVHLNVSRPTQSPDGKEATVNHTQQILVTGQFLGFTEMRLVRKRMPKHQSLAGISPSGRSSGDVTVSDEARSYLPIIVELRKSILVKAFTISVAIMVSLNYINMGCALDLSVVRSVLKTPVAPAIGFFAQFMFMPLIGFALGWLFLDEPFLRLGLFAFSCSPGGGASNIYTLLFGANLNLSITMTFISTLSAIFMLPIWLFTLGRTIYEGTTTSVPFTNIIASLLSMTIFLGIGLLFQRFLPRVAKTCRRILAPVSILMVVFIICFGTYANLFMFKLMTWRIILAAGLNVWCGFLIGILIAIAAKLPLGDVIAIAIETGIQNTGISIVLLRFSLPEPDRDIASVVPVAASVMTPIPLLFMLLAKKLYTCYYVKVEVVDGDKSINNSNSSKTTLLVNGKIVINGLGGEISNGNAITNGIS